MSDAIRSVFLLYYYNIIDILIYTIHKLLQNATDKQYKIDTLNLVFPFVRYSNKVLVLLANTTTRIAQKSARIKEVIIYLL